MSIRATLTVLRAAGMAGVPVLLWGPPGEGKSSLIETLGRIDRAHTEVVIGSLREPADFAGLPVIQRDGSVALAPPRWARNLVDAGGGYLFLDELTTASPAVQAAMLRVAKDKVVGDLALPSATRIIAAANPIDVAAGGWELEPPTANRFLHLSFTADLDTWTEGMAAGFEAVTARLGGDELPSGDEADLARATALVVGFLHARPTLFSDCPTDPTQSGRAWPSPRTWTYLREVLARLPEADLDAMQLAACGLVGDKAAVELLTWMRHSDLPEPGLILDGSIAFDPHDRADRVFAVLTGVVTVAVSRGGVDDWTRAWELLAQVQADVAAGPARTLLSARPAGASVPDTVLRFEPALRNAGLLGP